MENKLKQVLITFDYELFLGRRSGQVVSCLIEPTNAVLSILNSCKVKGMFFVDTLFLYKLKENGNTPCIRDFNLISEQLVTLVQQGHFVFPHVHPHWLDAVYLENSHQWDLSNTDKYRVSSLSNPEIDFVFKTSLELLNGIFKNQKLHYSLDCYRAGGWSIQPFVKFKEAFNKYAITKDFSVLPGCMADTSAQQYNFLSVPQKNVYHFKEDVTIEEINGPFTEYTISSLNFSSFTHLKEKVLLKLLHKLGDKGGFGKGESLATLSVKSVINKGEMASIELLTAPKLKGYLNFLDQNNYLQFISHPKMFSNHNLNTFKKFLLTVSHKYKLESDYRNIN